MQSIVKVFTRLCLSRGVGGGGGGGGGGGKGNLGVILVRVCEPVFQNLPHSYTWSSKKWTYSYTWSSKMLTYSYTALWFFVSIYCWLVHKYHSQFILYQEDKQPWKISEWKICAYTRMSEKCSHRNPEKSGHSYTFCWKKGASHIPDSAEKGGGTCAQTHLWFQVCTTIEPPLMVTTQRHPLLYLYYHFRFPNRWFYNIQLTLIISITAYLEVKK